MKNHNDKIQPNSNKKNSRIFVVFFVCLTLAATTTALVTNFLRRPETEAATASVEAGRKALEQGKSEKGKAAVTTAQKLESLDVTTLNGTVKLQVEVMRTPDEQARGLMFRQSMLQDQGMLFDFGLDRPVSMWMKNTYIPLDMVFVLNDGRIHRIEENTEPLSERNIASGIPIRAVLELNAGTARRLSIKSGDKILHLMFSH